MSKFINLIAEKTYPHSGIGRWMKEKWKDQYGKECGSGESYKKGKYPKCRPSKRVSKKTPETWGQMTKSEKSKAVRRKQKVRGGVSSHLNEENVPTNPELWQRAKSRLSGQKHSAYKMAAAAKWYKSQGGGWRSKKNESTENRLSFFYQNLTEKSAAWQRKEGKDPEGGLNRKGVKSYRRENPGSKLKMAVTTKPSKLKKGSKAWKRRKSFCARMSGMPGPMKRDGKPTRKALSLRKWNCENYSPITKNFIIEEIINKKHKGKMTPAMKTAADECAKKKPRGIKPIKGNDNQANAYSRYCTYVQWKKHYGKKSED